MSAIGAAFARGIASLGGPQVAAAVVVGGIVVGGLGGGFIASRSTSGQSVAPSGELAVYPCPNQGPALIAVKGGQKLLATGRTEDGTWLRIHYPLPGRTEAWIQTTPVTVEGAVASLPVATCAAEVAMAAPDVRPGPSLTVTANNPPSLPPSPTAGPTAAPSSGPTPPPNARPSLAALTVSTSKVSYDTASYCPTATKKVTFKVNAADTSGLGSVTLFWREPGAATYAQSAMSRTAGTAKSGTWQVTLDTKANGITKAGTLAYYAIGTDTAGATRRIPTSGANAITVAVCANTGPTITSASSSSGSSLYWDPLGVGSCQTATNITAVVKDVDGIRSVTLFYRRPGSSSWSSKPMNSNTIPGKWYANLDTLGDKISIPKPPTGALSWYIKAVDNKNVAAQSKAASLTIRRCDTEATFYVNAVGTSYSFCPQPPSNTTSVNLMWSFSVADPDTLTSAALSYRILNSASGRSRTQTVKVTIKSQRFSMSSGAIDGNSFYGSNLVTWTITTTDRYGGKSSASSKATVNIFVC